MGNKQLIIVTILLIIALGGGFLLLNQDSAISTSEEIASPPVSRNKAPVSGDYTIRITPEGFSPLGLEDRGIL